MPYKQNQVSLAAVITEANKEALVPNGNRITDISILAPRGGASFVLFLLLGNNQQPIGPITQPCVIEIDDDAESSDSSEGLYLINDTAQAGVVVPVMVSYVRAGKPNGGGVKVALG